MRFEYVKNLKKTAFCLLTCCLIFLPALPVQGDPVVLRSSGKSEGQESSEAGMSDRLRAARDEIQKRQVGCYGMTPVYGRDIEDGTYPVEVETSSQYFRIPEAYLTVDGDGMSARVTIRSMSYRYVYMGFAEDAEKADEADWIDYEEVDGCTVFTIPVESLDSEIPCAAFSRNREIWYDRMLVFDAASLPEDALKIDLPDYELIEKAVETYVEDGTEEPGSQEDDDRAAQGEPEAAEVPHSDGEYSVEVNMTGGSGRASISSPTLLTVRDGKAYARLIWSSTYYDYMILEGKTFYNLTTDGGNSLFEIPVTMFDQPIPVIADTTAMGEPLEIDYALTFYSDTIGDKDMIPQEAAKKVLLIALVILVGGGILNHFLKKRNSSA